MSEASHSFFPGPQNPHCVVGSGPAAVSCATALLRQGHAVHMIDAGVQLEAERKQWVDSLARTEPEQWDSEIVQKLKEGMDPGAKGIPEKRLFGSNFPYRGAEEHLGIVGAGVGLRASLAYGGLSNVWGAAMLPYFQKDISDWPITIDELAAHYNSVLDFTHVSGDNDAMNHLFPFLRAPLGQLKASRQAQSMIEKLNLNESKLKQAGIHHGRARVAIQPASRENSGCNYCGFCMYGCPYGYIYKSGDTVEQLKLNPGFSYQADFMVTSVAETNDQVTVSGYHRLSREPLKFTASRVYLAAGIIPTTTILLRSLSAYDQTVRLKDSQYFLLPALLTKRIPNVRQEKLHALSQLFLEVLDHHVSSHAVHLQVYSYNDLIGKAVRKTLGPLAGLQFLARELEGRLVLFQGFLHSAHSSKINLTLRRNGTDGKESVEMTPEINPEARRAVHRLVKKLMRHSGKLGAIPLPMMLQIAEPGRSFHVGGSFPMSKHPQGFETDLLGRPVGWKRVHAVDASIFPTIPATTITFSAMANAYRIGLEASALG